jgi:hypothetical protein
MYAPSQGAAETNFLMPPTADVNSPGGGEKRRLTDIKRAASRAAKMTVRP